MFFTYLLIMLFMAGIATPSPIPMQVLMANSGVSPIVAAMGVITVAMLHQITPNPRTFFPPY